MWHASHQLRRQRQLPSHHTRRSSVNKYSFVMQMRCYLKAAFFVYNSLLFAEKFCFPRQLFVLCSLFARYIFVFADSVWNVCYNLNFYAHLFVVIFFIEFTFGSAL